VSFVRGTAVAVGVRVLAGDTEVMGEQAFTQGISFNSQGCPQRIRLLEFNRPAHSPWLTVAHAQDEIAIQRVNEEHCFIDEYGAEVIRG